MQYFVGTSTLSTTASIGCKKQALMLHQQIFFVALLVISLILSILAQPVSAAPAQPPILTGDASVDFAGYATAKIISDPQDASLKSAPNPWPYGIVGWDVSNVYMYYDSTADRLYFGIECFGKICGDIDGDGDPGRTSPELAALPNADTDEPNLGGSEEVSIFIDTNMDAQYDVAIGVSAAADSSSQYDDLTDFDIYAYRQAGVPDPADYGSPFDDLPNNRLPNAHTLIFPQTADKPDFEFAIDDFSTLPNFSFMPGESFTFVMQVSVGTDTQNDGIGEHMVNMGIATAVELTSFTAAATGNTVVVNWETATEANIAGFNLSRATTVDGVYTQVNAVLIAAHGNGAGASYRYEDATSGGIYYYKLEDVDFNGVPRPYKPVKVSVGGAVDQAESRLFLPLLQGN